MATSHRPPEPGGRNCIGIDDAKGPEHGGATTVRRDALDAADPAADAASFAALFRALYLSYHRRDGPRSGLTGASRAVLGHLAHTGPLTICEAALHLDRAQSVVSEIVDGLERRGPLMRDRDPADRRRTLVWITPAGTEALRRDDEVLSEAALAAAMTRMTDEDRRALLTGAAALVAAAPLPSPHPTTEDRP